MNYVVSSVAVSKLSQVTQPLFAQTLVQRSFSWNLCQSILCYCMSMVMLVKVLLSTYSSNILLTLTFNTATSGSSPFSRWMLICWTILSARCHTFLAALLSSRRKSWNITQGHIMWFAPGNYLNNKFDMEAIYIYIYQYKFLYVYT